MVALKSRQARAMAPLWFLVAVLALSSCCLARHPFDELASAKGGRALLSKGGRGGSKPSPSKPSPPKGGGGDPSPPKGGGGDPSPPEGGGGDPSPSDPSPTSTPSPSPSPAPPPPSPSPSPPPPSPSPSPSPSPPPPKDPSPKGGKDPSPSPSPVPSPPKDPSPKGGKDPSPSPSPVPSPPKDPSPRGGKDPSPSPSPVPSPPKDPSPKGGKDPAPPKGGKDPSPSPSPVPSPEDPSPKGGKDPSPLPSPSPEGNQPSPSPSPPQGGYSPPTGVRAPPPANSRDYSCSDPNDVSNFFLNEIQASCQTSASSLDGIDVVQRLTSSGATGPAKFDEYRIAVARPVKLRFGGYTFYYDDNEVMDLLRRPSRTIPDDVKPPQCNVYGNNLHDTTPQQGYNQAEDWPAFKALIKATSVDLEGSNSIEEGATLEFHVGRPDSCEYAFGPLLGCQLPVGVAQTTSTSFTFVTGSKITYSLLDDDPTINYHTVNGARTFFVEAGDEEEEVVIGTRGVARAHEPALNNQLITDRIGDDPEDFFEVGLEVWVEYFDQIQRWLPKQFGSSRNCDVYSNFCSCTADWSELSDSSVVISYC